MTLLCTPRVFHAMPLRGKGKKEKREKGETERKHKIEFFALLLNTRAKHFFAP